MYLLSYQTYAKYLRYFSPISLSACSGVKSFITRLMYSLDKGLKSRYFSYLLLESPYQGDFKRNCVCLVIIMSYLTNFSFYCQEEFSFWVCPVFGTCLNKDFQDYQMTRNWYIVNYKIKWTFISICSVCLRAIMKINLWIR